jgi:hypothetical protein
MKTMKKKKSIFTWKCGVEIFTGERERPGREDLN